MSIDSKQLSQLLESIAEALDISDSHYEQAVNRYEAIGKWMNRDESSVARFNPEIYPQGSIVLGTVTKPISDADEYDMDLVSELSFRKIEITQEHLKNLIGTEIKGYAGANNMNSPAREGRRHWTLNYAEGAQFHMDILPAIPDSDAYKRLLESRGHQLSSWSDSAIAITDNTLANYRSIDPDWPRSNPKGYAAWFRSRMETEFNARRKIIAESSRTQVEDVPEYKVKTPLQRAIQVLKRHRDVMFAKNPEDKPISIIITTLAGLAYNNEPDLLDTLKNLVACMPNHIQNSNGAILISNPVDPLENFADKWQEHPQREHNFYEWLRQVQQGLDKALKLSDIPSVLESLKPCLGARVINEAVRNLPEAKSRYVPPLAASASRRPGLFDVPHRQAPKWPVLPKGWVEIRGWASRRGFRPEQFKNDSTPLPKSCSLRFEARTKVPRPYRVHWQVVNTGGEAFAAKGLRGNFYNGILENGCHAKRESTLYKGMHWIECFIVKDGACWARSGEFVVNIQ